MFLLKLKSPSRIADYYVAPGGYVRALCLLALGLFLGVTGKAKADYVFTTIDPPGSTFTEAHRIDTFGQIVGSYDGAGGIRHSFLLSGSRYNTFDPPGATWSSAWGINNSGQMVGSYIDAGGSRH